MKLIIAYIQPERLNAVKQALYARQVYKMSVSNALARLSTFASTANFFRGVTPRDGVVCRESSRIASRNAV